jgi:3-oxoisoapionate kinase
VVDLLDESQYAALGALIAASGFVVGSSAVEDALVEGERGTFPPVQPNGPILAVCGSCSPVSSRQVDWALSNGFVDVSDRPENVALEVSAGRSVVIHTRGGRPNENFGRTIRNVLEASQVRRVLVAGGDTSGQVARALGIESLEMVGQLVRGSPLCRAAAPNSPADGIEVTFKGGQIGPVDFFGLVRDGVYS